MFTYLKIDSKAWPELASFGVAGAGLSGTKMARRTAEEKTDGGCSRAVICVLDGVELALVAFFFAGGSLVPGVWPEDCGSGCGSYLGICFCW